MPNPYHDETGRFTSRGEMAAAAERLAREGRMDEALALSDELKQLEDARFDSGVNFGALTQRVGAFFGRKPKASSTVDEHEVEQGQAREPDVESELPPLPEGRFAMEGDGGSQHEFQMIDQQRFPHVRGFYATGEHEAESFERLEAVNAAWGLQAEGEKALSAAILSGVKPYAPEQIRYFHNDELRETVPDLSDWEAQNETQAYIVGRMVEAMVSQRTAAFQNAGLEQDPAVAVIGIEDVVPVMKGKDFDAPDAVDEGLISNFDEGWLCAYQRSVTIASQLPFEAGDEDSQQAQLVDFLGSQHDLWLGRHRTSDSAFDDGGVSAFDPDNWYD